MGSGAAPQRTVVVLGVAYGGVHAAATLAKHLPADWRVVAIDRQSHANHLYPFPRFTLLPHHAPLAFIPLSHALKQGKVNPSGAGATAAAPLPETPAFGAEAQLVQAHIVALSPHSVSIVRPGAKGAYPLDVDSGDIETITFDYAIYALGAAMPAPNDVWGDLGRPPVLNRGGKLGCMARLAEYGARIDKANSVLVVGGGALEFATDIKELHPAKDVTLLHSRQQVMPIYHQSVHDAVMKRCAALGVKTVLGERVMEWPMNPDVVDGTLKTVKTDKGSELSAEIILICTGTRPQTQLLASLSPDVVAPGGRVKVRKSMQVDVPGFEHFYAVGDVADTPAIQAGHNAHAQGGVAARNLLRRIADPSAGEEAMEAYIHEPHRIKISLGLKHAVVGTVDGATENEAGVDHLHAKAMWTIFGGQELPDDA